MVFIRNSLAELEAFQFQVSDYFTPQLNEEVAPQIRSDLVLYNQVEV